MFSENRYNIFMITKNDLDKGNVPDHIITALETIGNHGFHTVIVGGAVRDLLLGVVPIEYDLASNAHPEDIEKIFEKTTNIGKEFGTIIVHLAGHAIEITSYRKESGYHDSRRPNQVEFSQSIQEDLKRRDFTMNAMAYNPITDEFFDEFNGLNHLNERRLVCVGDPNIRFTEDTLRPFRCFRFMAQLGCIVDSDIMRSLNALSDLPLPAMERIRQEMDRLLLGPFWLSALNVMDRSGWLERILKHSVELPRDVEIPRELLYRWAWVLSFSSDPDCTSNFLFSKRDAQLMLTIRQWNYDTEKVDLTIQDLAVSSQQLMDLGFSGKALGDLQNKLLDMIRNDELNNSEYQLLDFCSNMDGVND